MAAKTDGPSALPSSPSVAAAFPDLRITVELGATLPVTDYGNVKPLIRVEGVDPRGDVAAQIQLALDTAATAFGAIDQRFEQLLSEIMSPASGKPGFTARVAKAEAEVERLTANGKWAREAILRIVAQLKEQKGRLDALQTPGDAPQTASNGVVATDPDATGEAAYAAFKAKLEPAGVAAD